MPSDRLTRTMLKNKVILFAISNVFCIFFALFHSVTVRAQTAVHRNLLRTADSLFQSQQWKPATEKYQQWLTDSVSNPVTWNRLGYCNYNLGLYQQSISNYEKALTLNPAPAIKYIIELRLARSYGQLKNEKETIQWLEKAAQSGYQDINEIDKLKDFDAVRNTAVFKAVYKKIYNNAYPCSADPKQREFDFWIGEWDVFQNGTSQLVGHSLVQKVSGECALLENWDASRGTGTGKSLNYFDALNNSWEQDWIGSMGGAQRYLNGVYKDSAMRFTYEAMSNGKKITGNFIFYNMAPGKVRQYQDVSEDGGKTFTVSYDFIYIRKK
jgi:tetratricopeptide (TPR) repeat protein